uniref:Uncharacterized protein n=1 Tax=Anguilla anguilla TaxID=7936 RepID=A0A0E9V8L1_ANGAN
MGGGAYLQHLLVDPQPHPRRKEGRKRILSTNV